MAGIINSLSSNYSKHVIGPDVSSLDNKMKLFTGTLEDYLAENKASYNTNFTENICTRIYNSKGNELAISLTDSKGFYPNTGNVSFLNDPCFGKDMLINLNSNGTDYAKMALEHNAGDIVNSNIDPLYSNSSLAYAGIAGFFAGAIGLPSLYSGLKGLYSGLGNLKSGNSSQKSLLKKSLIKTSGGALSSGLYLSNLKSTYYTMNSSNYVAKLLGLKGTLFNLGTFLLGSGAYNVWQGFKDKNIEGEKGKANSEFAAGASFLASGSLMTYSSITSWTSLAYEGAGLFSIITKGAIIASSLATWGGIFAIVGIAAKLGYWIYSKHNNKKLKK